MSKKIVLVPQKFLETTKKDKIINNVFISGIPNNMEFDDRCTGDNGEILRYILA